MIYIDKTISTPLNRQIYNCIVDSILSNHYKPFEKLPATRKLAMELSVSRNTVILAYQQLLSEGYITSLVGSGYMISDIATMNAWMEEKKMHFSPTIQKKPKAMPYNFTYGNIDNHNFPYSLWKKSLLHALEYMENQPFSKYPNYKGEPMLQTNIASYLHQARGITCDPSQIIITSGHQFSMKMIATLFQVTGKRLAFENPGYDGTRKVFEHFNYTILPIPVEKNGVDTQYLNSIQADLLYLTPSHQFPTGSVLPIKKRLQVIQWAHENNSYIIEDDYDSELRYYTPPIPSMCSLDSLNKTIYAGTFSKTLLASIRVAYLVLPHSLLPLFHQYYANYNSSVSVLIQLALADFISCGNYERHLNRLRTTYKKKQKELLHALYQIFGKHITIIGDLAGIHFLILLDTHLSSDELIRRAAELGIEMKGASNYYLAPLSCPKNMLLLGYSCIPSEKYLELFTQLAKAWNIR